MASSLFVYISGGDFVATIAKQHKAADTYSAGLPWLVLHNTGKVRKCESLQAARDEAAKAYPGAIFKRA